MAAPMRCFSRLLYRRFTHLYPFNYIGQCYLVTDEYKCHNAWQKQIQSPLLQKIETESFLMKLLEKMDKNDGASAIDMDIVACKLEQIERDQLDFVQNLIYRFRHSKDAINVRESMSHAVIRSMLHLGETERLLNMLRDKINYGIFLDSFTAILLLDHFIISKQYKEAAEVACDLMLQEDFSHPLCRILSWRSCILRIPELVSSKDANVDVDDADESNVEEEELMYRRVAFIESPWYDDHFDIPTEKQRIGKTLTMVATTSDDMLGRSSVLLGWALYEKFDKVLAVMSEWLNDENMSEIVNASMLDMTRLVMETVKTQEPTPKKELGLTTLQDLFPHITEQQKTDSLQQFAALSEKLKSAGKISSAIAWPEIDNQLTSRAQQIFSQTCPSDIQTQCEVYESWIADRQAEFDRQIENYRVNRLKSDVAQRLLDLRAREEKLRYFELQADIDLVTCERPPETQLEDVVSEEEFVAPPGERKESGKKRR